MKKILITLFIICFSNNLYADVKNENKCKSAIQKLKPSCNIIGSTMEKMKKFSKEHKTIDQKHRNLLGLMWLIKL